MNQSDSSFVKHGLLLLGALILLTIFMIIGANVLATYLPRDESPAAQKLVVEQLQPYGGVYAGETGAAAKAAAEAAAKEAAKAKVAYGGTLDGGVIYDKLCSACHAAGVGGAPNMTKGAWQPRIAQGMDTLVKHAIDGYQGSAGVMPARGGNASLTDEQVRASVEWMVENLK